MSDYGQCPHDPRCIHGATCRIEVCPGCGRTYHVLGIYEKDWRCWRDDCAADGQPVGTGDVNAR